MNGEDVMQLSTVLWIIFWGSLAGLSIIALFVLPHPWERKNKE